MAAKTTTINVTQGDRTIPITVSVADIERYITGLAQTGTTVANDPYTAYLGDTAHKLTSSELTTAMRSLGYNTTQIHNVMKDHIGGGSWLGNAIQGIAGGLAAVGPEASGLGDALDLIPGLSAASDTVELAPEATTTGAAVDEGAAGAGAGAGAAAAKLASGAGGTLLKDATLGGILGGLLTWGPVRLLELVAGVLLIFVGIKTLTGIGGPSPLAV